MRGLGLWVGRLFAGSPKKGNETQGSNLHVCVSDSALEADSKSEIRGSRIRRAAESH